MRSERNSVDRLHRQPRLLVPVEGRARPAAARGHPLHGRAGARRSPSSRSGARPRPAAPKDEAAWTNVWKGLDLEHALTPVKLQALKKEIAPDAVKRWPAATAAPSARWPRAYGSELVLARRRRARRRGQAAQRHAERPRRRRRLHAAGAPIASMRPIPATPASSPPSSRSASSRGAGRPSSRAAAAAVAAAARCSAARRDLLIAVEFRGMGEWQDISRQLGATPGVEELEVAGLSARGARVTLRYAGRRRAAGRRPGAAGPEPAQCRRQLGALGCNRPSTGAPRGRLNCRRLSPCAMSARFARCRPCVCHANARVALDTSTSRTSSRSAASCPCR